MAAKAPCDCISFAKGYWSSRCSCGNYGDCANAADWCATQNERTRATVEALRAVAEYIAFNCDCPGGFGEPFGNLISAIETHGYDAIHNMTPEQWAWLEGQR